MTRWNRFRSAVSRGMNRARGAVGKIAAGPMNLLRGVFPITWGQPPEMGTRDLLEGFDTMPWLRAVADKVGYMVASLEWQLLSVRGAGGKAVRNGDLQRGTLEVRGKALKTLGNQVQVEVDHVFMDAINDPNPFMGRLGLLKVTEVHLDLVGEAFWMKERNALGTCVGFWPVPPHWVLDRPLPDNPVYRISYRNWQVMVPEREMVMFLEPSPVHPYTRGSGIGWALGDELEVDEYAAKMAKALFFNQARPDFIVYGFDSAEEKRRLERDWENRLQGFWRAHKPYFLTGEPKFHEFQRPTMDQLVYPALRKAQRDIVIQTWGLPPELFGISEHGALARTNYEGAEYITAKYVTVPRAERMRQVLQKLVSDEYDARLVVHFVSPIGDDKAYLLQAAKAVPHAIRLDEYRTNYLGLPPIGGDLGQQLLPAPNSHPASELLDHLNDQGGKAAQLLQEGNS